MLATIEVATANGVRYGAKGMLLTDWGDMGHWQYLPVSYAGYAAGGALSWNSKSRTELKLGSFLNSYIFNDESSSMGDLVLDLGRYDKFEEIPLFNMTTTMMSFQFGMRDKIMTGAIFEKVISGINDMMKDLAPEMIATLKNKFDERHPFDYKGLQSFLDSKEAILKKVRIKTSDSLLIRDEYVNAIRLIRLGSGLQKYINFRSILNRDEEKLQLTALREIGGKYLEENHRLWLLRNKPGGYDRSTALLNLLIKQIDDRLLLLDKSFFARSFNRFMEKIGTAGAILYLKTVS
jgi:hexosaminidase